MTKVVLLGTGTPRMVPNRYMSSLVIIVDDKAYVVDCGSGVLERLSQARAMGLNALDNKNLTQLFITHFHPDHTVGLPGFIISPWNLGREKLGIYGPRGIKNMVDNVLKAFELGINEHLNHGPKPLNDIVIDVQEFTSGTIYKDELVEVEAIPVEHGTFNAFAFKFTTPDKTIVISGDTTSPIAALNEAAKNCDILVHEVFCETAINQQPKQYRDYMKSVHTSGRDLGKIAAQINPKKLVLTHQILFNSTEEDLLDEIKENYKGELFFSNDLDVFE